MGIRTGAGQNQRQPLSFLEKTNGIKGDALGYGDLKGAEDIFSCLPNRRHGGEEGGEISFTRHRENRREVVNGGGS